MKDYFLLLILVFLQGSCASMGAGTPGDTCDTGLFLINGNFPGGRLGSCKVIDANHVVLNNQPEDKPPINHSPWYGFRIQGEPGPLYIRINYSIHQHRYWPKIRVGDKATKWSNLPEDRVKVVNNGRSVEIELQIGKSPVWVSAQENLDSDWYENWLADITKNVPGAELSSIGTSLGGREILALQTNPTATDILLLVGRQHPPEVTGAIALRAFLDQLLEGQRDKCDDAQSLCTFFANTNVVLIPNLNPDGVALGHWRNSLGHIDLNRDWGIFSQPETRAVEGLINQLVENGKHIRLFLDFHSTQFNLFYTQSETEQTDPAGFSTRWLAMAKANGVYEFSQQRRHNEGSPTAKNYMFARFGIPSITYEVGDETDRDEISSSARIFARTMIKALGEKD